MTVPPVTTTPPVSGHCGYLGERILFHFKSGTSSLVCVRARVVGGDCGAEAYLTAVTQILPGLGGFPGSPI